jgi:outer membrane protein OmpA-like peptidoglycan-associated protein
MPSLQLQRVLKDTTWSKLGVDNVYNLVSRVSGDDLSIQPENEPQRSFVSDLEVPVTLLEKLGTEHRAIFRVLTETDTERDPAQSAREGHESVTKMGIPRENSVPKEPGPTVEKTLPANNSQPPGEQLITASEKKVIPDNDGLGALRQHHKTLPAGHGYTTFGEVSFQFDSAEIDPEYRLMLDALATTLVASEEHVAHIFGYTDNVGDSLYNAKLSERRANSVASYFMDKGVKRNQLLVEGRGIRSVVSMEDLHKQRTVSIYIESNKATRDFLSYKQE